MTQPSQPAIGCAARQLCASDTPNGADSSGSERNGSGFVVRKRLNHAALPALCKLEVAGSIPARSTRKAWKRARLRARFAAAGRELVDVYAGANIDAARTS
jgi:hypothetical protein